MRHLQDELDVAGHACDDAQAEADETLMAVDALRAEVNELKNSNQRLELEMATKAGYIEAIEANRSPPPAVLRQTKPPTEGALKARMVTHVEEHGELQRQLAPCAGHRVI